MKNEGIIENILKVNRVIYYRRYGLLSEIR